MDELLARVPPELREPLPTLRDLLGAVWIFRYLQPLAVPLLTVLMRLLGSSLRIVPAFGEAGLTPHHHELFRQRLAATVDPDATLQGLIVMYRGHALALVLFPDEALLINSTKFPSRKIRRATAEVVQRAIGSRRLILVESSMQGADQFCVTYAMISLAAAALLGTKERILETVSAWNSDLFLPMATMLINCAMLHDSEILARSREILGGYIAQLSGFEALEEELTYMPENIVESVFSGSILEEITELDTVAAANFGLTTSDLHEGSKRFLANTLVALVDLNAFQRKRREWAKQKQAFPSESDALEGGEVASSTEALRRFLLKELDARIPADLTERFFPSDREFYGALFVNRFLGWMSSPLLAVLLRKLGLTRTRAPQVAAILDVEATPAHIHAFTESVAEVLKAGPPQLIPFSWRAHAWAMIVTAEEILVINSAKFTDTATRSLVRRLMEGVGKRAGRRIRFLDTGIQPRDPFCNTYATTTLLIAAVMLESGKTLSQVWALLRMWGVWSEGRTLFLRLARVCMVAMALHADELLPQARANGRRYVAKLDARLAAQMEFGYSPDTCLLMAVLRDTHVDPSEDGRAYGMSGPQDFHESQKWFVRRALLPHLDEALASELDRRSLELQGGGGESRVFAPKLVSPEVSSSVRSLRQWLVKSFDERIPAELRVDIFPSDRELVGSLTYMMYCEALMPPLLEVVSRQLGMTRTPILQVRSNLKNNDSMRSNEIFIQMFREKLRETSPISLAPLYYRNHAWAAVLTSTEIVVINSHHYTDETEREEMQDLLAAVSRKIRRRARLVNTGVQRSYPFCVIYSGVTLLVCSMLLEAGKTLEELIEFMQSWGTWSQGQALIGRLAKVIFAALASHGREVLAKARSLEQRYLEVVRVIDPRNYEREAEAVNIQLRLFWGLVMKTPKPINPKDLDFLPKLGITEHDLKEGIMWFHRRVIGPNLDLHRLDKEARRSILKSRELTAGGEESVPLSIGGGGGESAVKRVALLSPPSVLPPDRVLAVLNDPRGWSGTPLFRGGRFVLDSEAPDLSIEVVSPDVLMRRIDAPDESWRRLSATQFRPGYIPRILLNADNWFAIPRGSRFASLDDYRTYLLNHEVGHAAFELGHRNSQIAPGKPVSVMLQQTLHRELDPSGASHPNPYPALSPEYESPR